MNRFTLGLVVAIVAIAGVTSANAADLFWDGTGTWDNSASNWGSATGGPYTTATWSSATPDNATFEGTPGTVTLGEAITVNDITFTSTSNNYTISDGTLNFAPGGSINQSIKDKRHTITSAITGSPTVNIVQNGTKDYGPGDWGNAVYNGLTFAPTSGTVTLGTINTAAPGVGGDKSGVFLGGTTTGNSVAEVTYIQGHYGSLVKKGTGTWTVGDVDIGTVRLSEGTLVVNGTMQTHYQHFAFASPGGTLAGGGTIKTAVAVKSGCTVAPGDHGVGTLTTATGGATGFADGSSYEWEVGDGVTDTMHVTSGTLDLDDFTLKILDAGDGSAAATDELPVFTYDEGVTIDLSGFANDFDTSELDGSWTASGLTLTDGGSGIIYLTGLSGGTPQLPGDANGNGFVDDTDLAILLGNWESDALVISTWALGNFTEVSLGDTDVDDNDLAVLLGNWTGPPPGGAAVPEPATLALLGLGGLSVLRRRRSCLRP